jgi:hypothetical protein
MFSRWSAACKLSLSLWGWWRGAALPVPSVFIMYVCIVFVCVQVSNWKEDRRLLRYKHTVLTSQETYCLSATESSQLMLCKIWGVHGFDYEECRLLGYKAPVRTSQETHYVSATELSQLMLCKIWGPYGFDYEECRLLGYKNPVRNSQETYCLSTTETAS